MKRVPCLLMSLFLTFFVSSVFGQKSNLEKSEQEIKSLIAHKWYPDSLQIGTEKVSAKFVGIDKDFIHFHSDGTFSDDTKWPAGYTPSKNKWYYNHKAKTITTDGGVKRILLITEKKLVFSADMDGQRAILFFRRGD